MTVLCRRFKAARSRLAPRALVAPAELIVLHVHVTHPRVQANYIVIARVGPAVGGPRSGPGCWRPAKMRQPRVRVISSNSKRPYLVFRSARYRRPNSPRRWGPIGTNLVPTLGMAGLPRVMDTRCMADEDAERFAVLSADGTECQIERLNWSLAARSRRAH